MASDRPREKDSVWLLPFIFDSVVVSVSDSVLVLLEVWETEAKKEMPPVLLDVLEELLVWEWLCDKVRLSDIVLDAPLVIESVNVFPDV